MFIRNSLGILAVSLASAAGAQDGAVVYQLGRDTVAIERFSRAPSKFSGDMVTRSGAAVTRTTYELTLANGRVTSATVKRAQPDGAPLPNAPLEYRFTFRADSATRTTVWRDSTATRSWPAANAMPGLPVFVYAPYVLLRSSTGAPREAVPTIPLAGNNAGTLALESTGGDTLRMRGGPYAMLLRYGADGRLLSVDGTFTTNKVLGIPGNASVDLASIGRAMRPTGVLSPRVTAQASLLQGPITINYGSPAVRGRTVWGGTLVPFDSVWRTGANEATHLAVSKPIQLGDLQLAPGLYTLWILPSRGGTSLIVNRQVGQWGTQYDATQDVGRVPMQLAPAPQHAEDFVITIRSLGGGRGAFDFAWGDQVATALFAVRQ
jgi:hypothetical protein